MARMSTMADLQEQIDGLRADIARATRAAEVASSAADRIANQAPGVAQSARTASIGIGQVGSQAEGAVDAAHRLGTGAQSIGTGIQGLGPSLENAANTVANSADRGVTIAKGIAVTAVASCVGLIAYDAVKSVWPLLTGSAAGRPAAKRNAKPARRKPARKAARR